VDPDPSNRQMVSTKGAIMMPGGANSFPRHRKLLIDFTPAGAEI
jgi:hypothetical protein